ncbi:hypothetical protein Dimus_013458 [Dionaea muscipula]
MELHPVASLEMMMDKSARRRGMRSALDGYARSYYPEEPLPTMVKREADGEMKEVTGIYRRRREDRSGGRWEVVRHRVNLLGRHLGRRRWCSSDASARWVVRRSSSEMTEKLLGGGESASALGGSATRWWSSGSASHGPYIRFERV